MSDDGTTPNDTDRAGELRAQIDAARAHLAATAEALAARATSTGSAPAPAPAPTPAPHSPSAPAANLPVPYRAPEVRRSVTLAGVVVGAVVLALRLRRRR